MFYKIKFSPSHLFLEVCKFAVSSGLCFGHQCMLIYKFILTLDIYNTVLGLHHS
jgi:hypothetical protein